MHRRKLTAIECLPVYGLVVGLVATAFFFSVAALSQIYPGVDAKGAHLAKGDLRATAIFVTFALVGAYLVISYFTTAIVVEKDRLTYRSLFRSCSLAWSEVAYARYFPRFFWFHIAAVDGRKLHIQLRAKDLPRLAEALIGNGPPEGRREKSRDELVKLVAEPPPRTWVEASRLWETRGRLHGPTLPATGS